MKNEKEHCLHASQIQHAMIHHLDAYCCFCNRNFCTGLVAEIEEGHGKYAPKKLVLPAAIRDEICEGRENGT